MYKKLTSSALLAICLVAHAMAQDNTAAAVIAAASKALGADKLQSISYSGVATNVSFGQTRSITGPWPGVTVAGYTRAIDFSQSLSRATGSTMVPPITGGPRAPGAYTLNVTAQNIAWPQQFEIWVTPWGFLKGAAANHATVKPQAIDGKNYRVVTWMTPQKSPSGLAYTVNGYIDDQNMVECVETWMEHPVLGDMRVLSQYSAYKDFGGVKVPTKIVQQRAGSPTFEATISSANVNPATIADLVKVPPPPQGAPGGGAFGGTGKVETEKLGDGVYRITGGYVAVAVEFKDHIVILEGGQSEDRGLAIIAEAKKLIPNKPIKYVFNTHPHFDHTSGLAPFVAEGATIITHENNVAFLNTALSAPRTLLGDTLAKANKKPKFLAVGDKKVMRDSMRTIEYLYVRDLGHSDGMLVAYLPKEKVLFQGDFTLPRAGQQTNPFVMTLGENLERWKLDYDRYVPVHAPNPDVPWTRADVTKALGK